MKMIGCYFRMELKKGICLLKKTAGGFLGMTMLLVIGIFFVSHFLFQSTAFAAIQVGISVPEDETETKMVTRLLSSMDSVKSICNFVYMDQIEALEKLKTGELQVVVQLPDNFYQDVDTGVNTPATVYFPYETTFEQEIFRELLEDGISLLQTAEAGVYAAYDMADTRQIQVEWNQIGVLLSDMYMDLAFQRGDVFDEVVVSSLGDANLYEYYFVSAITICLLMCGLNYSVFYCRQSRMVEQKLRLYGMGRWKTSLVKVLVMTVLLFLVESVLYLSACVVMRLTGNTFVWIGGSVLLYMLPVCFSMAAFFHMVFKLCGEGMQGSVLLLIVNIIMILISGAIVPQAYLPDVIGKAGAYLPMTSWNQYGVELFFGNVYWTDITKVVIWGLAELGIGEVFAWKNT